MFAGNVLLALLISTLFGHSLQIYLAALAFLALPYILARLTRTRVFFAPVFALVFALPGLFTPYPLLGLAVLVSNSLLEFAGNRGVRLLYPFKPKNYSLAFYKDLEGFHPRDIQRYFRQQQAVGVEVVLLLAFLYRTGINSWLNYFVFMTASSTLIPLPSDLAVAAMTPNHNIFAVAIVGGLGNTLGATFDYYLGTKIPHKGRLYWKLHPYLDKFKMQAFFWLLISGLTPLPFDPFRLASGYTCYDLKKYWLAVFLSRTTRFLIISWLGYDILWQHLTAWLQ